MSPLLILIIAALVGLRPVLRHYDLDEPLPARRPGIKAWWF